MNETCLVPGCPTEANTDVLAYTRIPICALHLHVICDGVAIHAQDVQSRIGNRGTRARYAARDGGGWVYFVRVGDRIKIGHTVNLRQRLAAYPPDALLLAAHPGTRQDEAALHQLFQSYRAAGREWYGAKHAPILDHIAAVRQQHGSPDELRLDPQRLAKSAPTSMRSRSRSRRTGF